MGPKAFCPMCGYACTQDGAMLSCKSCKMTIFDFKHDIVGDWGSESFFASDEFKKLEKFIIDAFSLNEINELTNQSDLIKKEEYASIMLEDDSLNTQTEFPEALELITNAYNKYKV